MKRNEEFERILKHFPAQFREGIALGQRHVFSFVPPHLIVCGMGGSALAGLIVEEMARQGLLKIPITIWRNYDLPRFTERNPLVVAVSYSGNTEETLASFLEARKRGLRVTVITSGGKLAAYAKKEKQTLITVPANLPPRLAVGFMTGALVGFLGIGRQFLPATKHSYSRQEKEGRAIAKFLNGKVPLIYAPASWEVLAHIWKLTFNESAQIPAFNYAFPEMNHNELMGLAGHPGPLHRNFAALFIEDPGMHPRIKKRMRLTPRLLRNRSPIKTRSTTLSGKSFPAKLIGGIMLGYWASYWLALERGANPLEERLIEEFKALMKK